MGDNLSVPALIATLLALVGAIVGVLKLDGYPKVRAFLLALILCAAAVSLWYVSPVVMSGNLAKERADLDSQKQQIDAEMAKELSEIKSAQKERDRLNAEASVFEAESERLAAERKRDQAEKEERDRELDLQKSIQHGASLDLQNAILGSWNCGMWTTWIFHSDGTVSVTMSGNSPYKIIDSKHLEIDAKWLGGIPIIYNLDLDSPRPTISKWTMTCRRN